jgi:hypothetical protein
MNQDLERVVQSYIRQEKDNGHTLVEISIGLSQSVQGKKIRKQIEDIAKRYEVNKELALAHYQRLAQIVMTRLIREHNKVIVPVKQGDEIRTADDLLFN